MVTAAEQMFTAALLFVKVIVWKFKYIYLGKGF